MPGGPLDTTAAEAYEKLILPAFMLPLITSVLELAAPRPVERVLDVACGTGLATRLVASRLAPGGAIAALDFDPAMLSVAQTIVECPAGVSLSWHCASALAMPFEGGTFDLAFCLQGPQFFPDPGAALAEIRRVMKPGGRLFVTVWSAIERCKGHFMVTRGLERRQVDPAPLLKAFSLGDPDKLRKLADGAGFHDVSVSPAGARAYFPSARHFVEALAAGAVAARHALARLPGDQREAFMEEMKAEFRQYEEAGGVAMPIEQLVLVARA
jgi:ubiquinone/menaquinone biosynthesis C-methylase UbiE